MNIFLQNLFYHSNALTVRAELSTQVLGYGPVNGHLGINEEEWSQNRFYSPPFIGQHLQNMPKHPQIAGAVEINIVKYPSLLSLLQSVSWLRFSLGQCVVFTVCTISSGQSVHCALYIAQGQCAVFALGFFLVCSVQYAICIALCQNPGYEEN